MANTTATFIHCSLWTPHLQPFVFQINQRNSPITVSSKLLTFFFAAVHSWSVVALASAENVCLVWKYFVMHWLACLWNPQLQLLCLYLINQSPLLHCFYSRSLSLSDDNVLDWDVWFAEWIPPWLIVFIIYKFCRGLHTYTAVFHPTWDSKMTGKLHTE